MSAGRNTADVTGDLSSAWHFHRPALAQTFLSALGSGLATTLCIFAPRRTGKTAFLRRDLAPAAREAGIRVAYADLWQLHGATSASIVHALRQARDEADKTAHGRGLARRLSSAKGGISVAGTGATLEVGVRAAEHAAEPAVELDSLVGSLTARAPLLLLVDEAQRLAVDDEAVATTRALRTAITKHADRLRVVFTGSSRTQLGDVFHRPDAPLYSVGSAIQPFPLLDEEFVAYLARRFRQSSGRSVDEAALWSFFERSARRPEPLLACLLRMLLEPSLSFKVAVANAVEQLRVDEDHPGRFAALAALDRAVLQRLAIDLHERPMSRESLSALEGLLGARPTTSQIQTSLARLQAAGHVYRNADRVWIFEDEAFRDWLKAL